MTLDLPELHTVFQDLSPLRVDKDAYSYFAFLVCDRSHLTQHGD
jgi:hypothetical protein